jgi:hypothetical protein
VLLSEIKSTRRSNYTTFKIEPKDVGNHFMRGLIDDPAKLLIGKIEPLTQELADQIKHTIEEYFHTKVFGEGLSDTKTSITYFVDTHRASQRAPSNWGYLDTSEIEKKIESMLPKNYHVTGGDWSDDYEAGPVH